MPLCTNRISVSSILTVKSPENCLAEFSLPFTLSYQPILYGEITLLDFLGFQNINVLTFFPKRLTFELSRFNWHWILPLAKSGSWFWFICGSTSPLLEPFVMYVGKRKVKKNTKDVSHFLLRLCQCFEQYLS